MTDEPFIPPKTQDLLHSVIPKGQRHEAAKAIAISLIGQGLSPNSVYSQLRDKFPPDVTDKELLDLVNFATGLNPTPCGFGPKQVFRPRLTITPPERKKRTPLEHATWWLSGNTSCPVEAFIESSKIPIPESDVDSSCLFLEMLYEGGDNLNLVCKFLTDPKDPGKARPNGGGWILTRDKWIEYVRGKGPPHTDAGAWFRPNPCQPKGSGKDGSVMDSDIVHHRFLLLESDVLPLEVQLCLFRKLRLPIAAVTLSGGCSAHALVRIHGKNAEDFSEKTRRILAALAPFGIDQANKNPSRLSRFPGSVRKIGATGDGLQRLLWMNPAVLPIETKDLQAFEDSLDIPALEEKPFRKTVEEATDRYDWLMQNKGKLGVPTGLPRWDQRTGGLKNGSLTIIAAETGVGKTTLAINFLDHALRHGIGVALFSLEMTRDEICDMLFSMNCDVNRNHFNTGEFTDIEVNRMKKASLWMRNLPLWINDAPDTSASVIRKSALSLKSENLIGLVVVDYAQLVAPDNPNDSREQQIAGVGRALRILAKDSMLPVVALSQVNDEGRLRESRVLGHEAHNVLALIPENTTPGCPLMKLKVSKGRHIPSETIPLVHIPEFCKMRERSPVEDKDVPVTRTTTSHNDP